ncbi:hypothetical protein Y032_0108g59 [Ancylostoma ceylanicum]|uniref:Uncharacterized protein n=1 Tax=Ancylostoma ceylanicum TaxID=53326 RepID=A0A016TEE6_9BILA|nr:hypothetical protein Y032_0108g59 [Ancylostoma ceylanicum]
MLSVGQYFSYLCSHYLVARVAYSLCWSSLPLSLKSFLKRKALISSLRYLTVMSTDGDSYDEEKDFDFNYWGDGTPMDANGNPKVFFKGDTEEGGKTTLKAAPTEISVLEISLYFKVFRDDELIGSDETA